MTFCEFFPTEYNRNYRKKSLKPAEIIYQRDYFSERIEEGEIDPRTASIPTQLDEAAEQLIYKHILDNLQTVYQVAYKHPWTLRDDKSVGKEEIKEKDLQSELVTYIHHVYFDPHEEKVLAPPITAKRMIGYIRPKLLHGSLSIYQDTFGRTGAKIITQENKKKNTPSKSIEISKYSKAKVNINKIDPCTNLDFEN